MYLEPVGCGSTVLPLDYLLPSDPLVYFSHVLRVFFMNETEIFNLVLGFILLYEKMRYPNALQLSHRTSVPLRMLYVRRFFHVAPIPRYALFRFTLRLRSVCLLLVRCFFLSALNEV